MYSLLSTIALRQMNDEVHAYSGLARVGIVPSAEAPEFQTKKIKIIKHICRFGAVNFTKMRLAAGLCPGPLRSYSAPPDSLAVISVRGGREWEGKGWKYGAEGEGRGGREGLGTDGKWKGGMERCGSGRGGGRRGSGRGGRRGS